MSASEFQAIELAGEMDAELSAAVEHALTSEVEVPAGPTWLTRYGRDWRADSAGELRVSGPHAVDLVKGTASYQYLAKCGRCGGLGGGEQWRHTGWTCFECGGSKFAGMRSVRLYSAERLAKLNAAQEKRNAARVAKAEAAAVAHRAEAVRSVWMKDNSEGIALIYQHADRDTFLADLAAKIEQYGSLSERQMAAALAVVERLQARENRGHYGVVGARVEMTIQVEKVIAMESQWGTSWLYLCLVDGDRVVYKGTANLRDGDHIKATIESHGEYNGEKQTRISRPKVLASRAVAA